MNRWLLSSLFAFSFGLLIGQKFFSSVSHGQRQPTNVGGSYLELERSKQLAKAGSKKPLALSEQMPMNVDPPEAPKVEAAPEVAAILPLPAVGAPAVVEEHKTVVGFLEKIRDVDCCSSGKPSDLHLSKLDLALDQSCTTLEKTCLEALWAEILSIPDVELMRAGVERYMVRYSSVDPVLVMTQAVELAKKDAQHLDAYAYANLLGIYYEQNAQEALNSFFTNQKTFGIRSAEFAKLFIANELSSGGETQAALLADLAPFAQTQDLAVRMRKKVFSDWFDQDPDAASQYAESLAQQDASILEIFNLKKQISSYKSRLQSRTPANTASTETQAEIQSQLDQITRHLASLTGL